MIENFITRGLDDKDHHHGMLECLSTNLDGWG